MDTPRGRRVADRDHAMSGLHEEKNVRAHHQERAAQEALSFVRSGMVVGLGSGTTAHFAVRALASALRANTLHDIVGVPTSETTERLARSLGVPLGTLEDHPRVDVTIDGADEVDPKLNLIKGAGGALLREKIVAQASAREVIVVDDSKFVPVLGTLRALPVEVAPFGWRTHVGFLEELGAQVYLRRSADGAAYRTDAGNFILDCRFGPLGEVEVLATCLRARAGVIEHGLFLGLATDVVSAGESGIRHRTRSSAFRRSAQ
jgi:ribose 5-phosphate isomerase A